MSENSTKDTANPESGTSSPRVLSRSSFNSSEVYERTSTSRQSSPSRSGTHTPIEDESARRQLELNPDDLHSNSNNDKKRTPVESPRIRKSNSSMAKSSSPTPRGGLRESLQISSRSGAKAIGLLDSKTNTIEIFDLTTSKLLAEEDYHKLSGSIDILDPKTTQIIGQLDATTNTIEILPPQSMNAQTSQPSQEFKEPIPNVSGSMLMHDMVPLERGSEELRRDSNDEPTTTLKANVKAATSNMPTSIDTIEMSDFDIKNFEQKTSKYRQNGETEEELQDPPPGEICYHRAAIYLLNYEHGVFVDLSKHEKHQLMYYKKYLMYYRPYLTWMNYIHLLLALFEYPSVIPQVNNHPLITTYIISFIELLFLSFYVADLVIQHKLMLDIKRRRFRKKNLIQTVLVTGAFIDVLATMAVGNYSLFVSRLFRPWYLVYNYKLLRTQYRVLLRTIYSVLDILFVIGCLVIFWSTGLYFFAGENFSDPFESFLNFFFLLTTVNFPDLMMQLMAQNRFYAVFFVIYVILGLYFLLNYLLANVASSYLNLYRKAASKSKTKNLDAAFDCLDFHSRRDGELSFIVWQRLFQTYKPDMKSVQVDWIFRECDTNSSNTLDRLQFRALFDVMNRVEVVTVHKPPQFEIPFINQKRHKTIQRLVSKKIHFVTPIITTMQTALYFTAVYLPKEHRSSEDYKFYFPLGFFLLEIAFIFLYMLWFLFAGWTKFWSSYSNRFNILCTVISIPIQLTALASFQNESFIAWRLWQLTIMLCSLRFLQVLVHIGSFNTIVRSLVSIASSQSTFLLLLVLIFYEYAVVALMIFHGKIDPNNIPSELEGSSYIDSGFQYNNFDNILTSYLVLFELLVVNNWHAQARGWITVTSRWSWIFFISFYLISVAVALNIALSFFIRAILFESGTLQPQTATTQEADKARKDELLIKLRSKSRSLDASSAYQFHFRSRKIDDLLEDTNF